MKAFGISLIFLSFYGLISSSKVLHKDNFDLLKTVPFCLVKFYAPWCGHCKKLAPEWDAAANTLTGEHKDSIAKVDCDENSDLCKKYGVTGYPTLKAFRYGEVDESISNIPRVAGAIVKLVKHHSSPASVILENKEQIKKFITEPNTNYKVLAYCEKLDDNKCKEFKKLADSLREFYDFAVTDNSNADNTEEKGHMVVHQPSCLHNKFEPNTQSFPLSDLTTMKKHLETKLPGLVDLRTTENKDLFKNPLCVAYITIDYENNVKHTNYWRNRVLKTLSDLKLDGKLKMAVSDKGDFYSEMMEFGFSEKPDASGDKFKEPPKVGCFDSEGLKYVMDTEFSIENLKKFIQDFNAGKIESYSKSEPIPESDDGYVKIAVGKNFKELVLDPTKDTLIEFYAPWCGHCKSLEPKYKELAEKLKDEDVVIAKMDATANDVPKIFEVKGYPTLFWLPKGKKDSPIPYEGGRDVDGMLKYIAKAATGGLKNFDKNGKKTTTTKDDEEDKSKSEL